MSSQTQPDGKLAYRLIIFQAVCVQLVRPQDRECLTGSGNCTRTGMRKDWDDYTGTHQRLPQKDRLFLLDSFSRPRQTWLTSESYIFEEPILMCAQPQILYSNM